MFNITGTNINVSIEAKKLPRSEYIYVWQSTISQGFNGSINPNPHCINKKK